VISVGRWSIISLLLFGICRVPLILAAQVQALSCDLHACLELAFAKHPLLQAGEARQSAARSQLDVRLAERRPTLDLEGESGYLNGRAITPFSAISRVTEEGVPQRRVSGGYYQATVGLEVPLIKEGALIGRASSSVQQAQLKISEEDWAYRVLRLQVALNVAEAYVHVLQHRQAIPFDEAIVAAFEEGNKLAQARFQQNLISRNELLVAEVRLATARRDLTRSRLALQSSQRALTLAMGMEKADAIEIQDLPDAPAPLPPLATLLTMAQQTHPELKARRFRVQGSSAEVSRIQSERYPTLSFTTNYGFVDAFEGRPDDQWLSALKVKVPIFDFGLIRRKAEVARAKVIEEEQRLQDLQLTIEQDIQERYLQLQELADHTTLLATQIEQATEEMKLKRAMLQQELLPQAVVLDAEAALLKLQQALTAAQYQQKLTRLQLSLVSGEWESKASTR
jgi:outer membrane protein